ncbi:MAG TPA: nuclear transport factor 2 family protein [Streptosporangiaceae bacterium]
MTGADMARALYTAYQARDWARAETYLHPDAVLDMPATGERLVGREQVLRFQREYPEPWGELEVLRTLGDDASAAAEVQVRAPGGDLFRMAAVWVLRDGRLASGTEYWVDPGGAPPPGRTAYRAAD